MFSDKEKIEFRKGLSSKYWASGVLIKGEDGRFLLVKDRHGNWTIPGGIGEQGESMMETLKREVQEEIDCKITNLKMVLLDEKIVMIGNYVDQSFQSVWVAELCQGSVIKPDGKEIVEYKFFEWDDLLIEVKPIIAKRLRNLDFETMSSTFVCLVNGEKI